MNQFSTSNNNNAIIKLASRNQLRLGGSESMSMQSASSDVFLCLHFMFYYSLDNIHWLHLLIIQADFSKWTLNNLHLSRTLSLKMIQGVVQKRDTLVLLAIILSLRKKVKKKGILALIWKEATFLLETPRSLQIISAL